MEPYGSGEADRGVAAYEAGPDFIRLRFKDGSIYLYDSSQPGSQHVDQMKRLARAGAGLTTYVNQHVGANYARKEA